MKRTFLVSIALLALLVPAASAKAPTSYNSTITVGKAIPLYHGQVRSRLQSNCEPDRRVRLYKKVPGPDVRVGRDRTNQRGKWTIEVPAMDLKPGQKYYATVLAQKLGNQIYCQFDRSDVVTYAGE
jgi:hypothetical protein